MLARYAGRGHVGLGVGQERAHAGVDAEHVVGAEPGDGKA
jgi:hypothetical protein